ncbi:MAG: toll/interleukin-1 receptor domain-containing protein, partial [Lachnospiraceae bacterium]|nr:toll/interleukin-1 receptor domain-containing protein [Lachnospiraceae bacterium]
MNKKEGKDITTAQEWQYDAFISYRHTQPDSFVAQTLHKYLESFKLPRSVVRHKEEQSNENRIKTRIHRVFRDREELPLVSNLADPITEALEHSEYLIVICSPRLNESMWCRKEIETFIQMHDREHVLAVLVEGEPETSFPEELLFREEKEYQTDGSVISKRVPVEPLAADVRGNTNREIRRKIKSELLRLAAPMFSCSYDDLKQRHREQRMRKVILTSVSASVICLLIGLVSTA